MLAGQSKIFVHRYFSRTTRYISGYSGSISPHNSPASSAPLVQHFRPRWPEPELPPVPADAALKLPETRTVPENVLRFQMSATFSHGTSIFYPHLQFNPADIKVALKVFVKDLGLSLGEKKVFIEMVGKRFNQGRQEVTLTCDRFPNRVENKRFIIVLLENLVAESKKIAATVELEQKKNISKK